MPKVVKLQIMAGKANPAPPIGPALGQVGLNIQEFCTKFNAATSDKEGVIPVEIIIADDKSYDLVFHTPPAAELIKKYANIQKGSGNPLLNKAGKLKRDDLKKIAEIKMPDLNTEDVEQAMKIVAGTARQMGVEIVD